MFIFTQKWGSVSTPFFTILFCFIRKHNKTRVYIQGKKWKSVEKIYLFYDIWIYASETVCTQWKCHQSSSIYLRTAIVHKKCFPQTQKSNHTYTFVWLNASICSPIYFLVLLNFKKVDRYASKDVVFFPSMYYKTCLLLVLDVLPYILVGFLLFFVVRHIFTCFWVRHFITINKNIVKYI